MKKSSFIYGAIILAIVNFVVRFIGFAYKIILSRQIGPEGIGLFQIASPVLMFFITFTTSGMPVAVSKLVAAQKALRNDLGCKKVLRSALLLAISLSAFFITIIAIFGQFICTYILKNNDIYYLIIMLSPAILIISISSIIRGYFYGLKKVSPPGIAQILEQISRIVFVLAVVRYFQPIDPRLGAIIAVVGISVGEIFGLLWLIFHYRQYSKSQVCLPTKSQSYLSFISSIIYIAGPITLSRLIGMVMQLANAVLIPQKLMVAGYTSSEAVAIFGKVMGMSMPILFLPFTVTSALVVNIIPNLSEGVEQKRLGSMKNDIALCLRIALLISIPLTVIFVLFSKPIAIVLYNDTDVGRYMSILGFSTIFLSLQSTLTGILNGLGKQVSATINGLIGTSFQLGATLLLVGNPSYGINGFFIGFIASSFIISTLNFFTLNKVINIDINLKDYVFKPVLASIISTISVLLSYTYLLDLGIKSYITLIISLGIGLTSYLMLLILIKALPPSLMKRLYSFK
ncbi:Stage V sporulation protein B Stage III sporulation protein F [Proteiniborus sp. DW1]|uniref:putative polysaccharide biosynthesis protein n=1 Tax=Proteiniborus sp. DW1 TaxID=1889883 RepID=UPI00092DEF1A|nr:polysaccharide biosynthesis protein [Proteiniborus sp. DW1]SCG83082.1 Stage V sporulation protein B Stage III sporulation protein F [Proteiniborus sp. DW1]